MEVNDSGRGKQCKYLARVLDLKIYVEDLFLWISECVIKSKILRNIF